MYDSITNQELAAALEDLAPCLADGGLCDEAARRLLELERQNNKLRHKLRVSRRKYELLEERCAVLERRKN